LGNDINDVLGLKGNTTLSKKHREKLNPVGDTLKSIGVGIFILGLISIVLILPSDSFPSGMKSTVVIFTLISSIIQCALFYGFSEVIYLLTQIRNKNLEE